MAGLNYSQAKSTEPSHLQTLLFCTLFSLTAKPRQHIASSCNWQFPQSCYWH